MTSYFKKLKLTISRVGELAFRQKGLPPARAGRAQAGMSYVELIVVLSIFTVMASIVTFNYGDFQSKVEIKNLASDIALKVVEAQKSAISGKWSFGAATDWKPSYGVYFGTLPTDDKRFVYFVDLNNDDQLSSSICSGECLENISITRGNSISPTITVFGVGTCTGATSVSFVYTRPNSKAAIKTSLPACSSISEVQIKVVSPKGKEATIKIYESGRIQIN